MCNSRGEKTADGQFVGKILLKAEDESEEAAALLDDEGAVAFNFPSGAKSIKHIKALLTKRFHYTKRDKQTWCCQYILPVGLILAGLSLLQFPLSGFFPYLELSTAQYNSPNYMAVTSELDACLGPYVPSKQATWLNVSDTSTGGGNDRYNNFNNYSDFSDYLLDNAQNNQQSRYGAYYQQPKTATPYPDQAFDFTIFTNITATHGLPTFFNLLTASMMRFTTKDESTTIATGFQAFDPTYSEQQFITSINGISASIVICAAFAFIPASFAGKDSRLWSF